MVCVPSPGQTTKFFMKKSHSSELHGNDSTDLLSVAAFALNAYLTSNRSFVNSV